MAKRVTSLRLSPVLRREIERLLKKANEQAMEESSIEIEVFPSTASFVRYLLEEGLTRAENKLSRLERKK